MTTEFSLPASAKTKVHARHLLLSHQYPPSDPCSCAVCSAYCIRPGWWTVEEALMAINAGYAARIMLEISPELTFGVLSPAFLGCEQNFALQEFSHLGCCFLRNGLCELHKTKFQPLECRFCHHDRAFQGSRCHIDLEKDWRAPEGQLVVKKWLLITELSK